MQYNVTVVLDTTATDEATTDEVLDALVGTSPAIGWDEQRRMTVTVTLDAESTAQATTQGVNVVQRAAGAELVRVEAMTTDEFDTHQAVA